MSDTFTIDGDTYQPSFNEFGKLTGCRDENDEYTYEIDRQTAMSETDGYRYVYGFGPQ